MTLYDLLQTCNIQGSYIIKAWDDRKDDYIVLQCGTDAEIELYNLSAYITDCRINYIYAVDGVLNIELKVSKDILDFITR